MDHTPFNRMAPITPSDSVDIRMPGGLSHTHAVFVGGAGNLVAVMEDGTTATFTGVTVGTVLPIGIKRVNATLTTTTNLMALWSI